MSMLLLGAGSTGSAVTTPGALQSVTTDTSTSPTTTLLTVPSWANGFRVCPGETPYTEDTFFLYVRRNGGSTLKSKATRWKDQFVQASAGDTVALGTSDGRTLKVTPVSAPASLVAPSAVTGTANCDSGVPPLWAPSAAHVTLLDYNQTINLAVTDATERIVFVSEYDGSSWTPPRWYRLPATGTFNVLCTYKQIALANEAAVTVTVKAPTGATIGGTSTRMSLPFPAITGTTWNCSTVAQMKTAIAGAVAGDEILLAAGTYSLDVAINRASFVANHTTGGRYGMEGITIRGATGTASDVVLTGDGVSNDGDWNLIHDSPTNRYAGYACFKDLTFNWTGINATLQCVSGNWLLQNVKFTGVSVAGTPPDSSCFACTANRPVNYTALYCDASNSGQDCWNGSGDAAQNASSTVRLVACTGSVAGPNANDQIVTTHLGLPVQIYGGTYTDANQNVFAADATPTSRLYAYFTTTGCGSRAGGVPGVSLFGCTVTVNASSQVGGSASDGFLRCNRITGTGFGAGTSLIRSSSGSVVPSTAPIEGNILSAASGRVYFPSVGGSAALRHNVVIAGAEGVRVANYGTGSTTTIDVLGNTFLCPITVSDASVPVNLKDNGFSSASGAQIGAGGATTTGNYNTIRQSAGYTPGANDTTGSNAAISATTYIPTASGNVDNGAGLASDFDFDCGSADAFGCVIIYGSAQVPRGGRARPGVFASAALYPGEWQ